MMKLDSNSKHGVLVGWFYLIAYMIFAIEPAFRIIKYVNSDDYDELPGMAEYILPTLIALLMATFSGLLIYGVVKKRHSFMAPWLVCTTIGLIVMVGILVVQCFLQFDYTLFILQRFVYLVGMQILIIYPIYNLYTNIREYSKKVMYSKNIGCSNAVQQDSPNSLEYPVKENNDILTQKLQV